MAVLQLVEAGELSLDTKVHEVVDDWLGEPLAALIPANNSMIEQVTVEQLLAHTSGLPDYEDENIRAWTLASPKRNFTPLDYIRYGMANGGNFHFAPGSGNIAIYSLPIPNLPALDGVQLHVQAATFGSPWLVSEGGVGEIH